MISKDGREIKEIHEIDMGIHCPFDVLTCLSSLTLFSLSFCLSTSFLSFFPCNLRKPPTTHIMNNIVQRSALVPVRRGGSCYSVPTRDWDIYVSQSGQAGIWVPLFFLFMDGVRCLFSRVDSGFGALGIGQGMDGWNGTEWHRDFLLFFGSSVGRYYSPRYWTTQDTHTHSLTRTCTCIFHRSIDV